MKNLKGRYYLEDLGIEDNVKMDLNEIVWEAVN
jgi:hypothetical protein